MKEFRVWSDTKNFGITNFGIHYDLLKIENVRNDNLHLRLSITQKIVGFIRGYLETYSFEIRDKFIYLLKKQWEDFYIDCYRSNKNLNVLVRNQVNAFVQELIPSVI